MIKDIDIICSKKRKLKFLNILNVGLASIFSLIGLILIMSLLMFLNINLGVSYLKCFMLVLILPSLYSYIVNLMLEPLDNKIKKLKLEIKSMENEYENKKKSNKPDIQKIELRFDGLSISNKLRLLDFIRERLLTSDSSEKFKIVEHDDGLSVIDALDKEQTIADMNEYSKKKVKKI